MSRLNIERVRVPQYNSSSTKATARVNYNAAIPFIEKANDYSVVTDFFAVDLSDAVLDSAPNYKIAIWCDLKDDDTPDGLVYGMNYFSFPGQLKTVDQITDWFYEILHKKALPYDLGSIGLNADDLFNLNITQAVYDSSYANDYFELYVNEPLSQILTELWAGEPEEFDGQLYYKLKTVSVGNTVQTVSKLALVNKIEAILVYSDLPVSKTNVFNPQTNIPTQEKILSTVELNTMSYNLRAKTDWIYEPKTSRHTTFTNSDILQSFELWIKIQYRNGDQINHTLLPNERFIINLAFHPRGEII